jgi:hypothetical protein
LNLKIDLTNIAKFENKTIEYVSDFNVVIFTGPNGVGKTSILKSISAAKENNNDISVIGHFGNEASVVVKLNGRLYSTKLNKGNKRRSNGLSSGVSYNFNDVIKANVFNVIVDKYNDEIMKYAKIANIETTDIEFALLKLTSLRTDKNREIKQIKIFDKTLEETDNTITGLKKILIEKDTEIKKYQDIKLRLETNNSMILSLQNTRDSIIRKITALKESIPAIYSKKSIVEKKIDRLRKLENSKFNKDIYDTLVKEDLLSEETDNKMREKLLINSSNKDQKTELDALILITQTYYKIELLEEELKENEISIRSYEESELATKHTNIDRITSNIDRLTKIKNQTSEQINQLTFNVINFKKKSEIQKILDKLEDAISKLRDIKANMLSESDTKIQKYNEILTEIIGYSASIEKGTTVATPIKLKMTDIITKNEIYYDSLSDAEKIITVVILLSEHAKERGFPLLVFDRFESVTSEWRQKLAKFLINNYKDITFIFGAANSIYTPEEIASNPTIYEVTK